MTTPLRIAGGGVAAALASAAMLTFAGSAGAKAGERTYQQTYPRASVLCAKVAAGGGPKRLRPVASQVQSDCATLQSGFSTAQSAVLADETSLTTALAADRAAIAAVCTPPVADRHVCRTTRRSEDRAIRAQRREHRAAVRLYYRTIEANRRTFWAEIHAFPGAASIPADAPIPAQPS